MGYLFRSASGQFSLLSQRVPLEKAMEDPQISPQIKEKLALVPAAKAFAENKMGLKKTGNYTSYVQLDRPAVTYVVSASPKWSLEHHLWHFPFIGSVPYKGFFSEPEAKEEEEELKKQGLDTYRRGVGAYSTLGWFHDPVLSSMLESSKIDLVNTIIHETVHATLYIKSSADFNERLATFLGNKGSEAFFLEAEGAQSSSVVEARRELEDERLFSKFIGGEIQALEKWYASVPDSKRLTPEDESQRRERLRKIQENFRTQVVPQCKTPLYRRFADIELNNARLLVYKTYVMDLRDFEVVFEKLHGDFKAFLRLALLLESEKHPENQLKEWGNLSEEKLTQLIQEGR